MSRVVFEIDFAVEGRVELITRASISHAEAKLIDGLMGSSEDTIIRIFDPSLEQEAPASGKKTSRSKRGQMDIEAAPSEDRQDDDDEEVGEADMQEIENIELEMEDRMIEDQMGGDEDDDGNDIVYADEMEDEEEEQPPERDWQEMAANYHQKKLTKRQLGYLEEPAQLPIKTTRHKKKHAVEQDEGKKLERQEKRRQHMRKQAEAQKMETLDRILNDAGRKQRQRTQRENRERVEKENKTFKTLGDVPKTVMHWTSEGCTITAHNTMLFTPESMLGPKIPMRPECYLCGQNGRYKVEGKQSVCSLTCYKKHKETAN